MIQLAGTVTVESGAQIGGVPRHVGGIQQVSGSAQVGHRTSVAPQPHGGDPFARIVSFPVLTLLLAFTFVLLPVATAGLLAGAVIVGSGVIARGDLIGDRLPIRRRGPSTARRAASVGPVDEEGPGEERCVVPNGARP